MTTMMPCEAIVERLKPMRFQPVVRLEPVTRPHALLDTKFGGPYYVPAGKNPPRNLRTGADLFLLAQLNFDQLPHIGEFPTHGLLQIFLDPDPMQFRASVHPTDQISWRIRYIPQVPSYTEIDPAGHMPSYSSGITTLPFPPEKYLPMSASNYMQLCAWEDFPYRSMLRRYCADIVDFNDVMAEVLAVQAGALLAREFKPGKQDDKVPQLGGYPTFSKNDPRAVDPGTGLRVPTVCLLQIPCFDGCNWGSDNIVHFFISQKDLRNCDFNHVQLDMPC